MNSELLEFLTRGGVLLFVAWLIGWRLAKVGVAYRYWQSLFVLLFLMALVGLAPAWRWLQPTFGETYSVYTTKVSESVGGFSSQTNSAIDGTVLTPKNFDADASEGEISLFRWLAWLWVGGVALGLLAIGRSHLRLRKLLRASTPLSIDGASVLQSQDVATPFSFGLFRRGIVVPGDFHQWPRSERAMALRHEKCHLERHDGFWQSVALLMAVLHWPNPLVWLARNRLEKECELAIDAEVLNAGASPTGYCELLIRLASGGHSTPAMGMAKKSSVPMRVEKILKGPIQGKVAVGPLLWLALGFLGGIAVMLGVTSLGSKPGPSENGSKLGENPEVKMFTNVYQVSPTFIPRVADGAVVVSHSLEYAEASRQEPQEYLAEVGIGFPEGSSAVYDPSGSRLIIRNTRENMDLMEALIESMEPPPMSQVALTTRMVDVPLGVSGVDVDWLSSSETGEIAGVFTDSQVAVIFETLKKFDVDPLFLPSMSLPSGKQGKVSLRGPNVQMETAAAIGADGYTIDLIMHVQMDTLAASEVDDYAIYLIEDESIDTVKKPYSITIWDGQTVLWKKSLGDEGTRVIFLKARIMDQSGKPFYSGSSVPAQSVPSPVDLRK